MKDYTLAEKLVDELSKTATDFDTSKATAAIETAKTDQRASTSPRPATPPSAATAQTLETELTAATEIWPRNPELTKISGLIFSQGDVQAEGARRSRPAPQPA